MPPVNYTEALGDALNPNMREGILNWLDTDDGQKMWEEMYNEVDSFANKWKSGYLPNEDWFWLTWGLIKRYPEWCQDSDSKVESVNLRIVEFMGFPPMDRVQKTVLEGVRYGNPYYQRTAKSLGSLYDITLQTDSKRWECLSKSLTQTYKQIKNPTLKAIFPYLGFRFLQYIDLRRTGDALEESPLISEEPNPKLKDAKLTLLKTLRENFNKNVCDDYISYFTSQGYLPFGLFINPKVLSKPFMNWDQMPF